MLQTVGLGKLRPNTLVLGYKKNWATESSEDVGEYVKVIQDAFELNYGVAILRVQKRLEFKPEDPDGEDDWFVSEEEALVTKEKSQEEQTGLEGSSEGQSPFTSERGTGGGRIFTVQRASSPTGHSKDSWDFGKSPSDSRTRSSSSLSEKPTILDSEINFLAASAGGSEAGDVTKEETSAGSEVPASEAEGGSVKEKAHEKELPCEEEEHKNEDERARLLDSEVVPVTFQEKQRGTIDVWWLFDDGGLTVLLPYLLSLHSHWKGCKLRILTQAREGIKTNEVRMVNLMKKFRIDVSSVVSVEGINRCPKNESIQDFMKLPVSEEFQTTEDLMKDKKTLRHIRLGEMLHEHSNEAQLIVITLPVPREDVTSATLYMSWVEMLSANLPPVLLVRGNHESVLTFYC